MVADGTVTGELLRELRCAAGIGLRRMAVQTHYTPSYLSLVETGRRPVTEGVLDRYRAVLSDPVLDGVDLRRLSSTVSDPSSAGLSGVDDLAMILDKTRHLEDTVGAATVVSLVRGMDGTARELARHGAGGRPSAALASDVTRYRGWLEHAIGRRMVADRVLRDAVELAQDGAQRAHALSFRSLTARHDGDLAKALDLADGALAEDGVHPALRAFDRYWKAELLARRGELRAAARELAADPPEYDELPPGGYWYTPGFLGVQRGLVLSCMGRRADGIAEATQGVKAMPAEHRHTDWLNVMLAQVDPDMRD
ncbi:helix-turn-helix domain-containing protein [Nocardia farcinica]